MPEPPKHSLASDFLWISPLYAIAFVTLITPGSYYSGDAAYFTIYILLSAVLLVPLIWRNRYPTQVFVAVVSVAALQVPIGVLPVPADLAVVVAMYAVARRCSMSWAIAAGLVTELGVVVSGVIWRLPPRVLNVLPPLAGPEFTEATTIAATIAVMLAVGTVWFAGVFLASRSRHEGEQQVQAARVRDQEAQITVANERAQIARELHDVVAHNVSVMVVHAEGGRQALDHDPAQTRQALDTIWTTGKQALAEMRRIVGILRDGDDAGASYAPQPGVAQIRELVEQVNASGPTVTLTIEGEPAQLSPGLQLVIYRVVQESLTNVLKHAGNGAKATVQLVYGENAIMIDIADDGAGATAPPEPATPGHGLVGMRERVMAYGGQLDARPHPAGGFLVRAWLPAPPKAAL